MTLKERLQKHEYDYQRYLKGKNHFNTSYKILENNNYNIQLIEECDASQRFERERLHIESMECVNKCRPIITEDERCQYQRQYRKQYRKQNREKERQRERQYYQQNREIILEKRRLQFKCQCGGQYTNINRLCHLKTKKHQKYVRNEVKNCLDDIVNAVVEKTVNDTLL
jgi:hypothetical protein